LQQYALQGAKVISRDEVINQIKTYVNSFTPENKFLGGSDEPTLLAAFKKNYQRLSMDDQKSVQEHYQRLFDASLTPEEKAMVKNSEKNFIKGAAMGAVAGGIGGAMLGNTAYNMLFNGSAILKAAINTGGAVAAGGISTFVGAFFGSTCTGGSHEQVREMTRKMRPFHQLKAVFGLSILGSDTKRAIYQNSENILDNNNNLRQRRHNR